MKLEMVTERNGIPLVVVTAAADVPETVLGAAALAGIPASVAVPDGVPVMADRGYDSDPLREQLAADGFDLVCRHRSNRTKAATADGRKLRRLRRRYKAERTFAWLHAFRRVVTRFEKTAKSYDGFVGMAVALVCLGKLIPEVKK
jgi:transposase